MKIVYLAHPVTHSDPRIVEWNLSEIRRIAKSVSRNGDVPLTSALLIPYDTFEAGEEGYGRVMEMAIQLVHRSDEMLVCSGKVSRGMEIEIAVARERGIPVRAFRTSREIPITFAPEAELRSAAFDSLRRQSADPCLATSAYFRPTEVCGLPRGHQGGHCFGEEKTQ